MKSKLNYFMRRVYTGSVKLESHRLLSEIEKRIDLILINVTAAVDIGFAEAAAALLGGHEPGTAAAHSSTQLGEADLAVLVVVETHQPFLELIHSDLVLASHGFMSSHT